MKRPTAGMSGKDMNGFWTTLPGVLTAIAALLTALVGLWVAIRDRDNGQPGSPVTTRAPAVSLTVQAAVLNPSERTTFRTHDVTVRVMTAGPSAPEIDHVTYLLPPSFATKRVTRSSADDGFALQVGASGSFLVQAKVYFADGTVHDLSKRITLSRPNSGQDKSG